MAVEYKLSYTGSQINEKLNKIDSLAAKSEIPKKVSDLENDAGYLTEHQSLDGLATETYANAAVLNHNTNNSAHNDIRLLIDGLTTLINTLDADKLDYSELASTINTTLAQAKASGEFDGEDGISPVRGTDYWTADDKAEIKSYVDEAILGGAW